MKSNEIDSAACIDHNFFTIMTRRPMLQTLKLKFSNFSKSPIQYDPFHLQCSF